MRYLCLYAYLLVLYSLFSACQPSMVSGKDPMLEEDWQGASIELTTGDNWQNYRCEELNISFKHPSYLKILDKSEDYDLLYLKYPLEDERNEHVQLLLQVTNAPGDLNRTKEAMVNAVKVMQKNVDIKQLKQRTFRGQAAYDMEYTGHNHHEKESCLSKTHCLFFIYNTLLYRLELTCDADAFEQEWKVAEKVFDSLRIK